MIDPNPMLMPDESFDWYSARLLNGDVILVSDSHFWNVVLEVEKAFCKEQKLRYKSCAIANPKPQQRAIEQHLDATVYRANYWLKRRADGDPYAYLHRKEAAA